MSKYDKSIEISHQEEGTYHRRQLDYDRPKSPVTTHYVERYEVRDGQDEPGHRRRPQSGSGNKKTVSKLAESSDDDNYEEWTTSKRKVNHKTRQVETRVSRKLLVRGGEVIADSGPQVVTRIKEDNKVEECEKEKTPRNKGRFEALENAPECNEGSSGLVLGEKKEIQRVSREIREENMQYHDERFKELTGKDVHRRAIQAPHELITIHDQDDDRASKSKGAKPRGKMIHYSNKGKKYQDTDEILEVAKLAIDGSVTKEVKRTKHHEEFSEDEKPDEKGEAERLKQKPIAERSSRRHEDYVNDFDDIDAPDQDGADARQHHEDPAFPRYDRDPLLNSLRDEDFRPATSAGPRARNVELEHRSSAASRRRDSSPDSSSEDERHRGPVEIPEEYRANKERLLSGRRGQTGSVLSQRSNRSQQQQQQQSRSQPEQHHHHQHSSRSMRREDAATQARLTDEEVERHSQRSDSPVNLRDKTTRHLQRQSTPNSSRRYYYGDSQRQQHQEQQQKHRQVPIATSGKSASKRAKGLTPSASSTSLSSLDEARTATKSRRAGATSRDSGFKSPHSLARTETPDSIGAEKQRNRQQQQQIYSVSSKHKGGRVVSPTPTTGSAGQRSVKTTTTTMSAGLADRPLSRSRDRGGRSYGHNTDDSDDLELAAVANNENAKTKTRASRDTKVSKPPSPFQRLANLFAPSSKGQQSRTTSPAPGRPHKPQRQRAQAATAAAR